MNRRFVVVERAAARARLEALQIPAFNVDTDARQNAVAAALLGDRRGKLDRTFVAPEDLGRMRHAFARKQKARIGGRLCQ
jgi:hypothetical protein